MKRVTQNLIISLAIAAGLLILTLIGGIFLVAFNSEMGDWGEDIGVIFEDGEVDTVEGHGAILEGSLFLLGAFSSAVVLALVIIVGGYAAVLLVFAAVARAVFAPQGGRLLAYRILMGVEYVLQAGMVWACMNIMFDSTGIEIVLFLVIAVAVAAGIVYSAVNTYSRRICE